MSGYASREDDGGDWCKECERYFLDSHSHDTVSGPSAEHIDAVAYAMVDCSMDIADRGGIPGDVWEQAQSDAADLLTYCRPVVAEVLAQIDPAAMLDALVRAGVLREDWCVNETAQPWRYYMRDEETARECEGALPGTVAERRYVTEWEVSGQ